MNLSRSNRVWDEEHAPADTVARAFPHLDSAERARLFERATLARAPVGGSVLQPDQQVTSVVLVVQGLLITRHAEQVTDVVTPGELVGLPEFVLQTKSDYSVEVPRPATLLAIPRAALLSGHSDPADVWRSLARHLAERLARLERDQDVLASADALEAIAWRLYELSTRWNGGGDVRQFGVPLTQADLGGWAGVSRESTVKALRVLRSRGLVQTGRRQLRVLDPEGLRDLLVLGRVNVDQAVGDADGW